MQFPGSDEMDALEQAGTDHGCDLRMDYSGRFMSGENCLALTGDSARDVTRALMQSARGNADLAAQLVDAWQQDQMGPGVVVYFPGFQSERDQGA
jgi:hypothetical protein